MNDLTPFDDDLRHQVLVEKVDAHLDAVWGRLDAATHPMLEKASDFTKSIISLSAGALVLSLSVTQFLQDRLTEAPLWGWLLPVAWVLLVVAIIAGVLRQGTLVTVFAPRARFEQQRGQIRAKVFQINLDGDVDGQFDKIIEEHSMDISSEVSFFDGLGHVMAWSFILALVGLVAFTLRNMPF